MTSKVLDWHRLLEQNASWAQIAVCEESKIDDFVRTAPSASVLARIIRGKRCGNATSLFHEWAAVLQFPSYFGDNWDSFEECLADMEWLPASAYVLFVTQVALVLQNSEQQYKMFVDILRKTADEWMTPPDSHGQQKRHPVLFRIVFHCEPDEEAKTRSILARAGLPFV